jgi:outer membrane protein assembly factor BamD
MRRLTPALRLFLFLTGCLAALTGLRAELVWSRETGWHVEGGVLAPLLSGEEGRTALDLMNKARSAEEGRHLRSALKLYGKVIKRYPHSVYAAEALYRSGGIYHQRKQYFKAFNSYKEVIARYPNTEKFNQIIGEEYRIASELLGGARPYIWGIIPGFRNRERAVGYFEEIVVAAPYSDYAPLSLMNAARGYKTLGSTEEAIDALDRMISTYPKSVLAPEAYLKLAETYGSLVDGSYYDQASTKEAITYYEDYLILYPGDAGAASAEKGRAEMKSVLAESKLILADYYLKYRKNYKAAKVFYNEAITTYPDSDVAAKAKAKLAVVDAVLEGKPPPKVEEPKSEPKKKKRFWLF